MIVELSPKFQIFRKKGLQACNFIKKRFQSQVFSCEHCKILGNTYFEEHLQTAASEMDCLTCGKWKKVRYSQPE